MNQALIDKALAKDKQKETKLHKSLRAASGDIVDPDNSKFKVATKEDRTSDDNIVFDSKQEKERYWQLQQLEKQKEIDHLSIQVPFLLLDEFSYKGKRIRGISYLADFYYCDKKTGEWVIEEWKVKATRTKEYLLKRKWLLYKYGSVIDFREMISDEEVKF